MIKKLIAKYVFPLTDHIVHFYMTCFTPRIEGAMVVVHVDGKFLLVRHTYGKGRKGIWTFPGGGVKRHEKLEYTAEREVKEETGIKIDDAQYLGRHYDLDNGYKNVTVHFFSASGESDQVDLDDLEIAEARWATADSIPKISENAKYLLSLYENKYPQS